MFLRLSIVCVIAALAVSPTIAEPLPRAVLVLNEFGSGANTPGYLEVNLAFQSWLRAHSTAHINIFTENLDLGNVSDLRKNIALQNYLNQKYDQAPINALVTIGPAALEFALQHLHSEVWENIPIIFGVIQQDEATRIVRLSAASTITGLTTKFSVTDSINVARALLPGLKYIALIGDPLERQPFRQHYKQELPKALADLALIDLTGLSLEEVKTRSAALPDNTVILYTVITVDGAGVQYVPHEALQSIAQVANRPIVVDVENRIGRGAIGGEVLKPTLTGKELAELALRVLNGESASQIPVRASTATGLVFDWRQLQRWGISESQLPEGSEIHFRPPPMWDQYRWPILLTSVFVLLQSAFVIVLLYERKYRHRAEAKAVVLVSELVHLNRVASAGQLTASIAHELRQPLTSIVAFGGVGLNWLKNTAPDYSQVERSLQKVINEGNRANEVINKIMALFSKKELPNVVVNVNATLRDVLVMMDRKLKMSKVQIDADFANNPSPEVSADPVRLQQVFLNLIMNAYDAMSSVPDRPRVIYVTTGIDSTDRVIITFKDTGPGIDEKHLDEIFNPFFTTKDTGIGMGLSICKTIIESFQGTITATAGSGGKFQIVLPRHVVKP